MRTKVKANRVINDKNKGTPADHIQRIQGRARYAAKRTKPTGWGASATSGRAGWKGEAKARKQAAQRSKA